MQVLFELIIFYFKVGGKLLVLKVSNVFEELLEVKNVFNFFFSKVGDNFSYVLLNGDLCYIIVVEKKKEILNKYLRKVGMFNKCLF